MIDSDDIEGELDDAWTDASEGEQRPQIPTAALAKVAADENVIAARRAADEARRAAEAAQAVVAEAEARAQAAQLQLQEAEAVADAKLEEAARAAHDAMRPEKNEWEIEVLGVRDDSYTTKIVDFVVHGAPNYASYQGRAPTLSVEIYMLQARRTGYYLGIFYPFPTPQAEEWKRLSPGKQNPSYREAALTIARPPMPEVHVPRSAHLDSFFREHVEAPQPLSLEVIEAACRAVFAEHLDLVDAERIRRGDPAIDRSFISKKITVRS